ncbi:MAG: hypothetical protein EBT08_13100, partial [Betaproteobacteria bacterium]|nr:hypothetical protein [Betaproteobacteria bacterium]
MIALNSLHHRLALCLVGACLFGLAVLGPAHAQSLADAGEQPPPKSKAINLVSAEEIERSAQGQYQKL